MSHSSLEYLRHIRLIHRYFGIDHDLVWDVVTNKVPVLHREIQQIIESESNMEEHSIR